MLIKKEQNKKVFAYCSIIFVVVLWGCAPLYIHYLYDYYSPSVYTATTSLTSAISLLIISLPLLKYLNRDYFKVAIPSGIFNSLASLLQKIGLQYTTPTRYAFLENLSCVAVPVLLFFMIKKKPNFITVLSCLLCLIGSFILTGMNFSSGNLSFGKGELLCAISGLLYGGNIAITGVYAKKLHAPLYLLIQMWIHTIISYATAFTLNVIIANGEAIEKLVFSWDFKALFALIVLALISNTLCWILRVNAMKHINTTTVAVIMPCSAIVTGILSVLLGTDMLTANLLIGAGVGFIASLLSSLGDIQDEKKKK